MCAEAVKQDIRSIIENKPKFLLVRVGRSMPCHAMPKALFIEF